MTNTLIHGANEIQQDFAGYTIAQIELAVAELVNIEPGVAQAFVDGVHVEDRYGFVVQAGQRIEWMTEEGEKGGDVWSEREFRERYFVNDVEFQWCVDAGMPFVRSIENSVALEFGVKLMEKRLAAGQPPDVNSHTKPLWNPDERTLTVGGVLIKSFNQPAKNQITLLEVFAEEGWPRRIDDPLDSGKVRQTVVDLNKRHVTKGVLRFHMDGTGEGITWEVCPQAV